MRNKFICLLLILVSIISINQVNAASNPYNQKEKVPNNPTDKMTNCTWYAWQQAYDNMGVVLPNFGNAKNWYSKAKSLGWHVGTEAKPNSIAVWGNQKYGHVGYVVSVNGSRMTVNEGGIYDIKREFDEAGNMISIQYVAYNETGIYNGNWASTVIGGPRYEDSDNSGSNLIGFIYLDYIPTTTATIKTTKTTKTTTSKSTTIETSTTEASLDIKEKIDNDGDMEETKEIIEEHNDETNNLKSILPYLILISISMFFLLLVLTKITNND